MTPENQIKALAELDGFKPPRINAGESWGESSYCGTGICVYRGGCNVRGIDLQYLNSYDAIIPLIQRLGSTDAVDATMRLRNQRTAFASTPAQLCEALLRATGKWQDDDEKGQHEQ